ncbi:UNVERIFIED_CONTAM: hypothetical protein FKN15_067742 [Acipenser sinensis]
MQGAHRVYGSSAEPPPPAFQPVIEHTLCTSFSPPSLQPLMVSFEEHSASGTYPDTNLNLSGGCGSGDNRGGKGCNLYGDSSWGLLGASWDGDSLEQQETEVQEITQRWAPGLRLPQRLVLLLHQARLERLWSEPPNSFRFPGRQRPNNAALYEDRRKLQPPSFFLCSWILWKRYNLPGTDRPWRSVSRNLQPHWPPWKVWGR